MSRKSEGVIPEQRRAVILEHIQRQGSISVQEVAQLINASESTIRRDLDELDSRGVIVRTHGGAMLALSQHTTFEPDYHFASQMSVSQKEAIGRAAVDFLQPKQSVFFDSSSTVFQSARFVIERRLKLFALTNDLNTAKAMADSSHIQLTVTGGALRQGSYTLIGDPGRDFVDSLHVDVCLLGIHSITLLSGNSKTDGGHGFSGTLGDTSLEVVAMKRLMVKAARKIIVLADSSKFGLSAFCDVCTLDDIDIIVTDRNIEPDQKEILIQSGIQLVIAD